jgi:hypothetical protein
VLQRLRDPAWAFLLIGGFVGIVLMLVMPPMHAIDETSHFARIYDLSRGHLQTSPSIFDDAARKGSGVCLPRDVWRDLNRKSVELYFENAPYVNYGTTTSPSSQAATTAPAAAATSARQCGPGEQYLDISTFAWYSPVPYLPQVAAFTALRPLGASTNTLAIAGRLANLAVFLGLVFFAIRRAPRARWALCISALLPIVMFQANSLSPDTLTTAAAILVVSSALRVLDHDGPLPRSMWWEAVGLSLFLGLVKPTYVVIALLYLLPLLDRARRRFSWKLLVPVALGGLASTVWQRANSSRFVCDVRFFHIEPSPHDQVRAIVKAPWRFLEAVGKAGFHQSGRWVRDVVPIMDRVMIWPLVVSVLVVVGFVALACQQDRAPLRRLRLGERVAIFGVFVIGVLAVLGGWLVYCNAPVLDVVVHPNARLFAPFFPVLFVAIAPDGERATRFGNLKVPAVLGLVAFYLVWLFDVARSVKVL